MADAEDKEKAEKVAAARKRYEQLKKQKAKKSTATGTTPTAKKTSKGSKAEVNESTEPEPTADEDASKAAEDEEDDEAVAAETAAGDGDATGEAVEEEVGQEPSLSLQSQIRSGSFRNASGAASATSPTGESVQNIYRKQAARIEALEKENKRLEKEVEDYGSGKAKMEDELEELRENRGDVVASATTAGDKGGEVEKLKTEVTSLQRQNAQLSQQAKVNRRPSGNVPLSSSATEDLSTQLADKTSAIESLELEISNLRHSLSEAEASNTKLKSRVSELEASLKTSDEASETAQRDVADMRARLESTTSSKEESTASSTADANRIALLTSDLHTAQRTATQAQTRASNLEKKIETLTTLHKESEARQQAQFQSRSKEMERLRNETSEMRKKISSVSNENARLRERRARGESISSTGNRPPTSSSGGGGEGFDFAAGDEASQRLQARVRELEAENTDLRRGVWRDKRREMQEATGDDDFALASPNGAGFDDVDLSTPSSYRRKSTPYNALGFTNIINTFTGRDSASANANSRRGSQAARQPQTSGFFARQSGELNEFDDEDDADFGFDEDAFAAAQEEQAKQRLERVREVKRGLPDWRGWKVNLVDLRGGPSAGVFDV